MVNSDFIYSQIIPKISINFQQTFFSTASYFTTSNYIPTSLNKLCLYNKKDICINITVTKLKKRRKVLKSNFFNIYIVCLIYSISIQKQTIIYINNTNITSLIFMTVYKVWQQSYFLITNYNKAVIKRIHIQYGEGGVTDFLATRKKVPKLYALFI